MENLGSGQPNIDLSKLSKEELTTIIRDLLAENIVIKDKIHDLEKIIREDQIKLQDQKVEIKEIQPNGSFKSEPEPKEVNSPCKTSLVEAPEETSEGSKENEDEKTVKSDKNEDIVEVDDFDTETYFHQMTNIIRDMAKSPSMILSKHEADLIQGQLGQLGQFGKKPKKERADIKMWERDIVPLLDDKSQKDKVLAKIKGVIYSFIPAKYRHKVWPLLIGNPLRIKRALYDHYCKLLETNPIDQRISFLIGEDLVRTYPSFKSFNRGEALNSELQSLLELFHFARPDIGYVQGMVYPATMLLLHMDKYHAFKCLMNMIAGSPFLESLYNFKLVKLKRVFKAFDHYLLQKCPAAHKHLVTMNVHTETFLIEWYYTLFCRAFSIHDAALIWDVYLLEGQIVFLRVALRIFQAIEPQLLKKDLSQTLHYIKTCTAEIDIDTIFKSMAYSKMTPDRLERFYDKEKKKGPQNDTSFM